MMASRWTRRLVVLTTLRWLAAAALAAVLAALVGRRRDAACPTPALACGDCRLRRRCTQVRSREDAA